jgi:hypothetical protein
MLQQFWNYIAGTIASLRSPKRSACRSCPGHLSTTCSPPAPSGRGLLPAFENSGEEWW